MSSQKAIQAISGSSRLFSSRPASSQQAGILSLQPRAPARRTFHTTLPKEHNHVKTSIRRNTKLYRPIRSFSSSSSIRSSNPYLGRNESAELQPSPLSQSEYERISEEDMETLNDNLSELCEDFKPGDGQSWEVEYSSGVLTLQIPPHGTYVVNKQPPNQQIWISSPFSGPARFGYVSPSPSSSSSNTNYPASVGEQTNTPGMENTASGEGLRGVWTHFRRAGVTLGGLIEGELRVVGAGKDGAEGWKGVGLK